MSPGFIFSPLAASWSLYTEARPSLSDEVALCVHELFRLIHPFSASADGRAPDNVAACRKPHRSRGSDLSLVASAL